MTPAGGATLLEAAGVEKSFGRTRALAGASLTLRQGEIHALLGANGAGKSTLSKVLSGHLRPDAGTLVSRGAPLVLASARAALDAGIAIVMQETSLAPDLGVLENIFLPELGRPGRLSFRRMRRRAETILADLGQALPLEREVGRLSAAQRQLVEIAKALALEAELIIFDEPTASLSPGEVERLFDVMARLKARGRTLAFVSHRLEEVFAITDRVTVLREGRTVLAGRDTTSLGQAEIIRAMVGRDLGAIFGGAAQVAPGDWAPVFEVRAIASPPAVRNVSFAVRRGEILGLAGLVGAGRSETAEAIFGLRPRTAGTIALDGRTLDIRHPRQAIRAGIGLVPEDRRVQNIVPDLSVRENLLLAHLGAHRGFGLGYAARQANVEALMRRLDLPAHRLMDADMLAFSGGMQQKIVIARWLIMEPKVLILDEPTKGVDIGTRQAIYAILRAIAGEGVAVVVISSDFEELIGLATRVVVVSDGRSIADLPSAVLDEEKLTLLAAPRTSMQRNTLLLEELATRYGGAGFWALIDAERDSLICLDSVVADPAAGPGFGTGDAVAFAATAIPRALAARAEGFVEDGGRKTVIVPIRSGRGHDLGAIGLTLAGGGVPAAAAIRRRIESINAREREA